MPRDNEGKALTVRWEEIGRAVDEVGLVMSGHRNVSVGITGMSIRGPVEAGGDFLATVRGRDVGGAPVVSFHGDPDLGALFRGLHNRLMNGSLKWRPDEWAK